MPFTTVGVGVTGVLHEVAPRVVGLSIAGTASVAAECSAQGLLPSTETAVLPGDLPALAARVGYVPEPLATLGMVDRFAASPCAGDPVLAGDSTVAAGSMEVEDFMAGEDFTEVAGGRRHFAVVLMARELLRWRAAYAPNEQDLQRV